MNRPTPRSWLPALFLVALLLRLGICFSVMGRDDATSKKGYREYVTAATRMLEHGTLVSPLILDDSTREPSALMPPAYVFLVTAVYRFFGVESAGSTVLLYFLHSVATALAAVLAYSIAKRMAGTGAAWCAGVVTALNPVVFGYGTIIWDTSLFSLAVVLTVWIVLRLRERGGGMAAWLGFGGWLGAVALLNPALTVAYPFLVLWPLTAKDGWRARTGAPRILVTIVGWMVVLTPWTIRNYHHFGELMYVRSGFGLELWLGVCPEADGTGSVYHNQFPLMNEDVQRHVTAIGERAFIRESGERARDAIAADPTRLAKLIAIRAVDHFFGTVYSHRGTGRGGFPRANWRRIVTLFMMAETVGIALGILLLRGRIGELWWLVAIVVAFSFVYCITHVQVRFRVPTEPLTAVILSILWIRLLGKKLRSTSS